MRLGSDDHNSHSPPGRDITRSSPTHLYHLKPEGVGTPLVESLVSYLARVAAEHCLSPMGLLAFVIGPLAGRRYVRDTASCERFFGDNRHIRALCGAGPIARDWARALEGLTGWRDLSYLTLLSLDRFMKAPTQATLRPERAWCPDCLDMWRGAGSALYAPLLWMMRAVALCPIHRTPFATVCPNTACTRKATWLVTQAQHGRCPHCGCWLGRSGHPDRATRLPVVSLSELSDAPGQPVAPDRMVWQSRVADDVGMLLALASQQHAVAPSRVLEQSLSRWRSAMTPAMGTRIQRRARVTAHMLRAWSEGRGRASLTQVVRLCRVLEITAAELLWSDVATIHRQLSQVAERLR